MSDGYSTENHRAEIEEREAREQDSQDAAELRARMQPPEPQTVSECWRYCIQNVDWESNESIAVAMAEYGERCRQLGLDQGRAEIRAEWQREKRQAAERLLPTKTFAEMLAEDMQSEAGGSVNRRENNAGDNQ